jgi:ribonuclease BN (tRNA processing enzyme)
VTSGSTNLVLDLGPGTFAHLQRYIDPASVTAVVITHRHPDHWTDLHPLATQARFVLGREGIPVLSPAGLDRRADLAGSSTLDFRPTADGDSARIGALDLTFHRTDHPVETLAVRVDGAGQVLGYSADTGPRWSLTQLGTGLDLVLCEASYTADQEGDLGHMSGRQAGEQGRRAGVRRLVLTHRWPTVAAEAVALEAEATFGGPVEHAELGKEFVL